MCLCTFLLRESVVKAAALKLKLLLVCYRSLASLFTRFPTLRRKRWCECSLVEFSRLLAPGGPRFRLISKAYVSALAARRAKRPSRSSRGQTTLPKNEAVWIMLGSGSIASSPGALEDPPYASPMTTIRFAAPKILTSQRMDPLASPACVALLPAAVRRPRECLDPRYAFDASLLLRVCQCVSESEPRGPQPLD